MMATISQVISSGNPDLMIAKLREYQHQCQVLSRRVQSLTAERDKAEVAVINLRRDLDVVTRRIAELVSRYGAEK